MGEGVAKAAEKRKRKISLLGFVGKIEQFVAKVGTGSVQSVEVGGCISPTADDTEVIPPRVWSHRTYHVLFWLILSGGRDRLCPVR